jgi:hypothetical protein
MSNPPKQADLARQIAEYQRNGGKIEQIEPGVLAKREGPASNNIKRANGVKV